MIITSVTPKELVNWFHTRQEDQRVLCVMLAPAREDQRKITELVAELYEADAVLGDEVAFLLIHPGAHTPLGLDKGYGRFATLRGSAFPVRDGRRHLAYPLRDTLVFRDMSSEGTPYRQEIAEKSARSMALFAPDFMQLFGMSQGDLPAMCVLVKGLNESIVLPLGKDWTKDSLLVLLKRLRSIADELPNFRNEFQTLADEVPAKLRPVAEVVREIESKFANIARVLELILRRYQGTERDSALIADFIARGGPSLEQLEGVLERLSFSSNERYLNDGQVTKVKVLMTKVETVREELNQDLISRRYVLSIADRAKQLVERRDQLFHAIHDLRAPRVTTTSTIASGSLGRVQSVLEAINLTGDLGEKLQAAVAWVRSLVANAGGST